MVPLLSFNDAGNIDCLNKPKLRLQKLEKELQYLFVIDMIKIIATVLITAAGILLARSKGYSFVATIIGGSFFTVAIDHLRSPYICREHILTPAIEHEKKVIEKLEVQEAQSDPRLARIEVVKDTIMTRLNITSVTLTSYDDFKNPLRYAITESQTLTIAELFFFIQFLSNENKYKTSHFVDDFKNHYAGASEKKLNAIRGGKEAAITYDNEQYCLHQLTLTNQ